MWQVLSRRPDLKRNVAAFSYARRLTLSDIGYYLPNEEDKEYPNLFSAALDVEPGRRIGRAKGSMAPSLDKVLALSAEQETQGLGDAPWPPQYAKQAGRVQPSKAKQPLITVAKAEHKDETLAGVERWKARHPEVAKYLAIADVLVDAMRGRSSTWTRIRVNLCHVQEERPEDGTPDPDYDPWASVRASKAGKRRTKLEE